MNYINGKCNSILWWRANPLLGPQETSQQVQENLTILKHRLTCTTWRRNQHNFNAKEVWVLMALCLAPAKLFIACSTYVIVNIVGRSWCFSSMYTWCNQIISTMKPLTRCIYVYFSPVSLLFWLSSILAQWSLFYTLGSLWVYSVCVWGSLGQVMAYRGVYRFMLCVHTLPIVYIMQVVHGNV